MAATQTQKDEVRRYIADPSKTEFTDEVIATVIEHYPLPDIYGQEPLILENGTYVANTLWVPTYDLHAAAADLWEEKGANAVNHVDYNADGASFSLSQKFEHIKRQAAYHRSRRRVRYRKVLPDPIKPLNEDLYP